MYDLHAHILPGVDDGARTLEDALKMARAAVEHGTKVMVATPHRKDVIESFSVQQIQERLAVLKGELDQNGVDLEILLGMETHLELELPEAFAEGLALPINGSRYALVELPFFGHPNYMEEVLFQLQLRGLTPVLAHPERIEVIQRNVDLLVGFVERGMLSQITAGSIVGHFGGRVKRFTHSLLRRGLVHVIASDTHFAQGPRSPVLSDGVNEAVRIVGEEKARAMVVHTPRDILSDLRVEVEPPREDKGSRRWWRLWRT